MSTTTTQTREQRDAELYLAYMLAGKNATAAAKASGVARSSLQDAVKRHTTRLADGETADSEATQRADADEITDQASAEAYMDDVTSRQGADADEIPVEYTSTGRPVTDADRELRAAMQPADEPAADAPAPKTTGKAKADKPVIADLPYGVVTPVAFRHQMVQEGLAPEALRTQTVYDWVKHTRSNGFPVKHYALSAGVDVHDEPQRDEAGKATTRPGVLLSQGRDWLVAKTERDTAKAAAKVAA